MKRTSLKSKRVIKGKVKDLTENTIDQALSYVSELDYKLIAKNVLKVAIPLVVLKMILTKYKNSQKKPTQWEKTVVPLFEEFKSKLRDL